MNKFKNKNNGHIEEISIHISILCERYRKKVLPTQWLEGGQVIWKSV